MRWGRTAGAIAVAAMAAASPAHAARADCWPPGSHTITQTRHARVYFVRRGGDTWDYACHYSFGRRVALEYEDFVAESANRPFRLAGPYVAYLSVWVPGEPYAAADFQVVVRDLRTGRWKRGAEAWGHNGPPTQEEVFRPEVNALQLRTDGAAAYISDWSGRRELWRLDSRGGKRLDTGPGIPVRSLRITRKRVEWEKKREARHASLR